MAGFANGVMVRYLDCNDYFSPGGGHPSDMIPPPWPWRIRSGVMDTRSSQPLFWRMKSLVVSLTRSWRENWAGTREF